MMPRAPRSTLFPYAALFRSGILAAHIFLDIDADLVMEAGIVGLIVGRHGGGVDTIAGRAGDSRGIEMMAVEGRGGGEVRVGAGAGRKREGPIVAEIEDEARVV